MTDKPYTYIGKDGKPVLARDLEDERDALCKELEELKAELKVERLFPEKSCMEETIRLQDKANDRLTAENKRLCEALEKTAAVADILNDSIKDATVTFTNDFAHLGTMKVSAILDEANAALKGGNDE